MKLYKVYLKDFCFHGIYVCIGKLGKNCRYITLDYDHIPGMDV